MLEYCQHQLDVPLLHLLDASTRKTIGHVQRRQYIQPRRTAKQPTRRKFDGRGKRDTAYTVTQPRYLVHTNSHCPLQAHTILFGEVNKPDLFDFWVPPSRTLLRATESISRHSKKPQTTRWRQIKDLEAQLNGQGGVCQHQVLGLTVKARRDQRRRQPENHQPTKRTRPRNHHKSYHAGMTMSLMHQPQWQHHSHETLPKCQQLQPHQVQDLTAGGLLPQANRSSLL